MATQEQIQRIINEVDNGKRVTEEEQEEKGIEQRKAEFLGKKYEELKAKGEI